MCIGASERTGWSAIVQLADELLASGFLRVGGGNAQTAQLVHLDTVFTQTHWDHCAVYRPLLQRGSREEASITRLRQGHEGIIVEKLSGNLLECLADEGHTLRPTFCGGGHPVHEQREQWTDGANYVALGPGIVVGYARNIHTARHMEEAGFEVMDPPTFLSCFDAEYNGSADDLFKSGRRIAIHIRVSYHRARRAPMFDLSASPRLGRSFGLVGRIGIWSMARSHKPDAQCGVDPDWPAPQCHRKCSPWYPRTR